MAGVPPVELLVSVQDGIALLKLSENRVPLVAELEVALDVKLRGLPEHMEATEADAVTAVGVGLTKSVLEAAAVPQLPPEVVRVSVTVPVNDEAGVYVAFSVVAFGLKEPPAPPSLHVPPVAEPPTEPPKAAEDCPLQMALNAVPALAVGCVHGLIAIPVMDASEELLKVVAQGSAVVEAGIVRSATPDLIASVT